MSSSSLLLLLSSSSSLSSLLASSASASSSSFGHLRPFLCLGLPSSPPGAHPASIQVWPAGVLQGAHDIMANEWRSLHAADRMVPQPEGLQEPGQRWWVFDLTAACGPAGPRSRAVAELGATALM